MNPYLLEKIIHGNTYPIFPYVWQHAYAHMPLIVFVSKHWWYHVYIEKLVALLIRLYGSLLIRKSFYDTPHAKFYITMLNVEPCAFKFSFGWVKVLHAYFYIERMSFYNFLPCWHDVTMCDTMLMNIGPWSLKTCYCWHNVVNTLIT